MLFLFVVKSKITREKESLSLSPEFFTGHY